MTLTYKCATSVLDDNLVDILADIRVKAMQESLEAIGRFQPERARSRFLEKFNANNTTILLKDDILIGFFVVIEKADHVLLDHLYLLPEYQGSGIGREVISKITNDISAKPNSSAFSSIRLGALRNSPANDFYLKQGFVKTHEEEWDIYYRRDL